MKNKITICFFGTDNFSVNVLEELKSAGFSPNLIVTVPDKPKGRKLILTPSEAKVWAKENDVKTLEPEVLNEDFVEKLKEAVPSLEDTVKKASAQNAPKTQSSWTLFIVASYGKIIPKEVLDIPERGALNVHPSLLPLYRGASPIESAILDDQKETGVTIMLMDEKMDHGPILNQELVTFEKWPKKIEVEEKLAKIGGKLLANTIPLWLEDKTEEQIQDHDSATFTKKIKKEDGLIDFNDDPHKNFLKIKALNPWPGTYFFKEIKGKEIRIKITDADFIDGELKILKVIPEGKKEMNFKDFERGH